MRTGVYRDELLSHFTGIEAIIRAHAKARGLQHPAAKVAEDEAIPTLLEPLVEKYGADAVNRLVPRSKDLSPSISDCFMAYSHDHGWEEDIEEQFRRLLRLRNPATHGDSVRVEERHAVEARDLLTRLLLMELATDG